MTRHPVSKQTNYTVQLDHKNRIYTDYRAFRALI
jgi:hypothetical protein